jgi:hypothetical protein
MTTDIDELLGILDMVIDDLTAALAERYQNVKIDLKIAAKPASAPILSNTRLQLGRWPRA